MLDLSDVTLAVLAGGQGRRMGMPKAELRIGGTFILEYLLSRWRWPGPTLLVTAPGREHPPGHKLFDAEVRDPVFGVGPLRGLLTALEACETQLLLATTVDMPAVGTAQFARLLDEIARRPDCDALMIARPSGIEPFPGVYRGRAIEVVRRHLAGPDRSMRGLARLPGIDTAAAPSDWADEVWINLNRPEDVERFKG